MVKKLSKKSLFCFGYGYCCDYLGHALQTMPEWDIAGTTRDSDKKKAMQNRGVRAYLYDQEKPLADAGYILRDATHLLISTPPDADGDPVFMRYADDIAAMKNLQWIGYLSTIGVYGHRQGAWVDENCPPMPTNERSQRRLKAEDQWISLAENHNLPLHIFRLAGIYGPGRSALDSIRAGVAKRVEKEGHIFNRIHVEDVAGAIMASFDVEDSSGIYNLSDCEPAPSHEVIAYGCELLGRPVPPIIDFELAELSLMARSFYNDNKRVRSEKITNALGYELKYKNFREGLKACMEAEDYTLSLFGSGKI